MRLYLAALVLALGAPATVAQVALTVQAGLQVVDLTTAPPTFDPNNPEDGALTVRRRDTRSGTRFGVGLNVPVGSGLAVRPEVVYAQKGYSARYVLARDEPIIDIVDRYYNALELPVLLAADVWRRGDVAVGLEAGPALVMRLDVTNCGQANVLGLPCVDETAPGKTDLGVAVGVSLSMGAGGLGIRYTRGGRAVDRAGLATEPASEALAVTARVRFR